LLASYPNLSNENIGRPIDVLGLRGNPASGVRKCFREERVAASVQADDKGGSAHYKVIGSRYDYGYGAYGMPVPMPNSDLARAHDAERRNPPTSSPPPPASRQLRRDELIR
jgi:hypothetical protein